MLCNFMVSFDSSDMRYFIVQIVMCIIIFSKLIIFSKVLTLIYCFYTKYANRYVPDSNHV